MAELACVAITWARAGHEAQVRQALETLVPLGRAEDGALQYDMHVDVNEPRCFVFVERWTSDAAFDAHVKSPHVADYVAQTSDWVERSEIRVMRKVD
jgi:quinol monooxygenase YgiN